jgi:hypothetical protein
MLWLGLPEFSDRPSLPYMNAILKKVIRIVRTRNRLIYLGPPSAGTQLRL